LALRRRPVEYLEKDKYIYILISTFTNKNDQNFKGLVNMALSKDIQTFRYNLSFVSISLNLVYADAKDNIGYQLTGKIPKKVPSEQGLIN